MGTMIQSYGSPKPTIAARASPTGRATSRATTTCWPSRARDHRRHPRAVPRGRRRHHRDQHLQLHPHLHGRLRHGVAGVRAERGRGRDWPAAWPTSSRPRTRRAPVRGRRARPDQPHRLALAGRERPGFPQRHLRRAGDRLRRGSARACSTAAPTSCWSRRSSTRSTPRRRCSRSSRCFESRAMRVPVMISRHHHRRQRPHAVGTDDGGVLELRVPRQPISHRPQLRPRRRSSCAPTCRSSPASPTRRQRAPERRPAQRLRRLRRVARRSWPTHRRVGRSGLLNIVGGCCGTTPAHIRAIAAGGAKVAPRAGSPRWRRAAPGGARAARRSAPTRTS